MRLRRDSGSCISMLRIHSSNAATAAAAAASAAVVPAILLLLLLQQRQRRLLKRCCWPAHAALCCCVISCAALACPALLGHVPEALAAPALRLGAVHGRVAKQAAMRAQQLPALARVLLATLAAGAAACTIPVAMAAAHTAVWNPACC
jgi:hypothetical protein